MFITERKKHRVSKSCDVPLTNQWAAVREWAGFDWMSNCSSRRLSELSPANS